MPRKISAADRALYLDRALKAADWFVNSQLTSLKIWEANRNRFLYYYFIPEKRWVPGINWTHGRALFVLADAFKATGDKRYLDSAVLGARYLKSLQPLDPSALLTYGAFRETVPQFEWGGTLDSAQAASGLLMLYRQSADADLLRRAHAFAEFLERHWTEDASFPSLAHFYPERLEYYDKPGERYSIHHVSAIPFWHLFKVTGERKWLRFVADSADRILRCQRPDGAINYLEDISGVEATPANHHWGFGEGADRFTLVNDDGAVTVVLAAYFATRDKRYLDAMVAYADWTVANLPRERPFNAFGVEAANVLDIGRAAGTNYTPWVLDHLKPRCLDLQVIGSGDPMADGGFRGEDEEGDGGIFGGTSLDYVPTRTTCYMAGLLFRLSGKGTGTGFSVFGLGD